MTAVVSTARCIGRALRAAAWAPLLVVLTVYASSHSVFGFGAPAWFDRAAHFSGGVAFAYFSHVLLGHWQAAVGAIPRPAQLVGAIGLTAVAAIVWELVELVLDRLAGTRMVGDLHDTLSDLALGLVGALAFAGAAALRRPRR